MLARTLPITSSALSSGTSSFTRMAISTMIGFSLRSITTSMVTLPRSASMNASLNAANALSVNIGPSDRMSLAAKLFSTTSWALIAPVRNSRSSKVGSTMTRTHHMSSRARSARYMSVGISHILGRITTVMLLSRFGSGWASGSGSGLASGSSATRLASTLTSSPSAAASSPFVSEGPALNPRAGAPQPTS